VRAFGALEDFEIKQTIIFLVFVLAAANGFPKERGRPQYPPGQTSGCPSRNLEPDSDLLTWPIVRDIGMPNLRDGFQVITQARLCEKAGDWSNAGNYYVEGTISGSRVMSSSSLWLTSRLRTKGWKLLPNFTP